MRPRTPFAALLALSLASCGDSGSEKDVVPATAETSIPGHVVVDHILIGVRGGLPQFQGKRTEAEARAFAYDLLAKLEAGANWASAKAEHSEDPPPGGPYAMADTGLPLLSRDEFSRGQMARAFGDVAFSLKVGEIGIADYHKDKSPFGFHIIKRTK
jgi:hypothetical protein